MDQTWECTRQEGKGFLNNRQLTKEDPNAYRNFSTLKDNYNTSLSDRNHK